MQNSFHCVLSIQISHTERIHQFIIKHVFYCHYCYFTLCIKIFSHCGCIYTDVPVVEITTATGGCGYVSVSWTVPDDNDACPVRRYTIKLLSSTMDELARGRISHNQYTFNGLSFNTLFYVTVFSNNAYVAHSNSVTTSVRTMDRKGMYSIPRVYA